jgi:hypothetical protein
MDDDRLRTLERELARLKRYAIGMTLSFGILATAAFRQATRTRFEELDVERLNVVEKDGTPRLAIANSARMAPVTLHGKPYPGLRGGDAVGSAGMIYFNDEGTENGGYVWSGRTLHDGTYRAAGFLTFDQYDQDETLTLGYSDTNGRREAGLTVIDEPNQSIQTMVDTMMAIRQVTDSAVQNRRMRTFLDGLANRGLVRANRVFVGKDPARSALVSLADPKGRPRLRLSVDSLGAARIEFLDETGTVTDRLPRPRR